MKIFRSASLIGLGKLAYDQARKPANQDRIRSAVGKVRESRAKRSQQA
ncbi:MAG: hypothetical protein ABI776_17640 [Nocardioidaceae bacterium]